MRVLRNRDRKVNISNAMRMKTPNPVEGLSIVACLTQGIDFCWPHVVVMRNGTAELDQPRTRRTTPTMKITTAR
jgi:hypothetical protein